MKEMRVVGTIHKTSIKREVTDRQGFKKENSLKENIKVLSVIFAILFALFAIIGAIGAQSITEAIDNVTAVAKFIGLVYLFFAAFVLFTSKVSSHKFDKRQNVYNEDEYLLDDLKKLLTNPAYSSLSGNIHHDY
jgi:arginine exporter protein ArgO